MSVCTYERAGTALEMLIIIHKNICFFHILLEPKYVYDNKLMSWNLHKQFGIPPIIWVDLQI